METLKAFFNDETNIFFLILPCGYTFTLDIKLAYFKWNDTKLFLMYNELDETSAAAYEKTEEKYLWELLKQERYMQVYLFSLSLFYLPCTLISVSLVYKGSC